MDFVADPFPNSSIFSGNNNTSPVLRVTYPQGSFNRQTGGAQFYNLWNSTDGSPFQSMMLSYEVAFDEDFDFVKGGKLPGLRGGLDSNGCAGGSESDGEHCWSARLMWRRFGNGEGVLNLLSTDVQVLMSAQCTPISQSLMVSATPAISAATMTSASACKEASSLGSRERAFCLQSIFPSPFLTLPRSRWNRVTLLVQMNDPVDIANGNIRM